jgi:hypothetical protein
MARNINNRLSQLAKRRRGTDRLNRVAMDSRQEILAKSLLQESWQKRAKGQSYTQYVLGSMQEVGADYTRISLETAERVGNQLRSGLEAVGITAGFRLQGSVPLNVHIRGVSDVDVLTLDESFFTYSTAGMLSQSNFYSGVPTQRTSLAVLLNLRTECEKILTARYPAATVDTSGGKAVKAGLGLTEARQQRSKSK